MDSGNTQATVVYSVLNLIGGSIGVGHAGNIRTRVGIQYGSDNLYHSVSLATTCTTTEQKMVILCYMLQYLFYFLYFLIHSNPSLMYLGILHPQKSLSASFLLR